MSKQRGRPPKPTALHIVRGNPGRRDLNADEPQPEHLDKAIELGFEPHPEFIKVLEPYR